MRKKWYLLILLCIFLIGCSNRNITLDEFMDIAEFNGYITKESKDGYEDYSQIKRVSYAINREGVYNVQFLELENDDYAHKFFLYNANDFNENVTSSDYKKTKSTTSYELYHAETISNYYLIIRCDTNIIYTDAPINYINEIEEFLSDLNMEY